MRKKPKIYLDTSVISALFDAKNPDRRSLTEDFFKGVGDFEVFISDITLAEIDRTPDAGLRGKMQSTISQFSILPVIDDVEWLAAKYIEAGAVPSGYPEDVYHIAVAVLSGADFLLSWNFRHIVRAKTRDIIKMVNSLNQLRQIEIMTPAELL